MEIIEKLKNYLSLLLLSILLSVGITATVPLADENNQLITSIQHALTDYGYYSAPTEGVLNSKTSQAIETFQKEYRLFVDGEASEKTASLLGVAEYADFENTQIIVLTEKAEKIAKAIGKRDHAGVINYLYELEQKSLSKIDMKFENAKTVVYVVEEDLKPGDVLFTQIEVIRLDLPAFFENFYYEIKQDTPTEPLIIINEAEAGWELQFTHRIVLNGKLIGEKRTRAAK